MNLERIQGLPSTEFKSGNYAITIEGQLDERLLAGASEAFGRLDYAFGGRFFEVCDGLVVAVLSEGVEGGGRADAAQRYIQMNYANNLLSVREAEAIVVAKGWFNPGDRLRLTDDPDKRAGIFPIELIHEVGHVIGGELPPSLSPTKYGERAPHESFAEAFLYYIYGMPQPAESIAAVEAAVQRMLHGTE